LRVQDRRETCAGYTDRVVGLPLDSYINGPYAQYIVTSAQSVVRAPANTDTVPAKFSAKNAADGMTRVVIVELVPKE